MKKIPTASYGSSYGYMSMNEPRSELGFAGIKNLGCICYMNAMIQQFFMTPTFRYGILMADDKQPPNMVAREL